MLENLIRLLNGEKPNGVVWTADTSYWIAGQKQAGTADAAWDTEVGYLKLHQDLGVMPYYYYPKFWTGKAAYDSTVEAQHQSNAGNATMNVKDLAAGVRHLQRDETFCYIIESIKKIRLISF